MTAPDVYQRLYALAESDTEELQKLAADIAAAAREPARVVAEAWTKGRQPAACAFVCTHLQELACAELLRGAGSAPQPGVRAQMLEQLITQLLLFREYLLAVLEPTSAAAYLLIRRLVAPVPEEADQFSSEAAFLALDEEQRTAEMDLWAESRSWTSLFVERGPDGSPVP